VNIVSDPSCRGAIREDSYHFFFDCSYYTNMRPTLFHNLSWHPNYCVLDLKLLTSGNRHSQMNRTKLCLSTCLNI